MEILTLDEVAELLKLKRGTVYELTRERSQKRQAHPLPHLRIAGKLRFNKAGVLEWLQKLESAG
jgi:excisionase family DNA binding protein